MAEKKDDAKDAMRAASLVVSPSAQKAFETVEKLVSILAGP